MRFIKPKNSGKIIWTKHALAKMRFYGLSENRIKRALRNPGRKEEGIAPNTLAIMQRTGTKKHPTEIWLMFSRVAGSRSAGQKIKIISAWRYPGISPKGKEIPIPRDILEELEKII
jgi:hypothetical protein